MMKMMMAAAALMLAAGAQAGTPDDMTAEAQAIRAVQQQRELAIKQSLARRWADAQDDNAVKFKSAVTTSRLSRGNRLRK